MATVTRENIGNLHDKITVKLVKEDYWPSFEKSLKQYARQANVPGFRKGMVPAGMVKKMYGQSLFGDEVLRSAGKELEDYLRNEKLAIFAQPMVIPGEGTQRLDMNTSSEVDFSFEVGLKPDFEIAALKNNTKLSRYIVTVSDKMLDDEIDRITRRYGKVEDQETINSKGDVVYLTYEEAYETGVAIEGGQKQEDAALLEKLPAKLQEMLMGKSAGFSTAIRPMDMAEGAELTSFLKDPLKSGPEAAEKTYKLTLTKVGVLIPHMVDAELYLQVFPNEIVQNEADFRDRIRKELEKEYLNVSNRRLHDEIFELLVHNTNIQLPVNFLKRWMKEGQEKPKNEAEVEKEFPSFDHQLRWTLISDKLIQENDIKVSYEEVMENIKAKVLAYFGIDADDDAPWMDSYMQKVKKDEKTIDETYRTMLFERLFQWLESQFQIEEKNVSEEEFFKLPDAHAAHHHHH